MSYRFASWAVFLGFVACAPTGGDLGPSDDELMNGGSANGGTGGSQTSPPGSTPFPCEVGTVLASKCWQCHGETTQYTAPMSLTSWESVQQTTKDGTEPLWKRIKARIHDVASPMPPALQPALTATEIAILDTWVDQGAPAGNGCAAPPGSGGSTSAGGSSNNGTGGIYYNTGGTSPMGTGGSGPQAYPDAGGPNWSTEDIPVEPDASECDYLNFTARQDANGTKFTVPMGEQYYCFGYHVDLEAGAQGLAFYPEIDNTNVIHHWLLYKAVTPQTNGQSSVCVGAHPDAELMAGWAPGALPVFTPEHVGQDLGTGDFILEVHYSNTTGAIAQDGSGVRVCKAKEHRPETASVSWLGTEWITIPGITGTTKDTWSKTISKCSPTVTEPIHILRSWPHMHKLGRHMTTIIHRANGTTEPLVDMPFDFNSQYQYDTPTILNAGDWLETTCYYENTSGAQVGFGEFTDQEMCYNFVTAYPNRSLVSFGLHSTSCNNP